MTAPYSTSLLFFATYHVFAFRGGFSYHLLPRLSRSLLSRVRLKFLCPHISDYMQFRNIYLMSIDYGSLPRLRSRLTQSRSALLWNPWVFGREDSHLTLATHSGILSSYFSTTPFGMASTLIRMLLYQCITTFPGFGVVFSPGHFRRRTSRLVSCYALF